MVTRGCFPRIKRPGRETERVYLCYPLFLCGVQWTTYVYRLVASAAFKHLDLDLHEVRVVFDMYVQK
jgi:hypothetical protein